jgi:beta-ribofuranosylaminobenzene 5'-phosphate synthase
MRIDVSTGSRLHFGLICGTAQTGWKFGGIGMMLRAPAWRISMQPCQCPQDLIIASSEATLRAAEFLKQMRTRISLPPVNVTISAEVPFHTGLGGGTQLGLALAAAVELLSTHRASHDPYQLAELAQRAERSAIGTAGFQNGGFLIDHGLLADPSHGRTVDRIAIPEDWRFVLVRPAEGQGLSGDQERSFFNQKVEMSEQLVKRLVEHIYQQLVPALGNKTFEEFATALESYGDTVGHFYAAEQGDVFADPGIRKLVDQLRVHGIHGAAQSSWGPGICIPAASLSHAQSIVDLIPASIDHTALTTLISEPMNTGATLRTSSPEQSTSTFA